ncbi:MAG: hypothetical protein ACTSQK_11500 [Candidatus Heimdallarchaeota archaeon]
MSKRYKLSLSDYSAVGGSTGPVLATAAALVGANLVVVALAWDNPPTAGGIVTITFLMMISFVAFIDVLHQLMRAELLISRLKVPEIDEEVKEKIMRELNQISRWSRFMHVAGLIFTMIAFWIISYKYLISIVGYHLIILLLPFILFVLIWVPKLTGIEKEVSVKSPESIVQLIVEIIFLVLICLDFFGIIVIL